LKINNISETGTLDLRELVYLDGEQALTLSERYSVRTGDLVTAAQATIGRTAVVDGRVEGAIISQHLIRVSPDPDVCLPQWLHACFSSPIVLRQLHAVTQGGTRAGLNTDDVANILIPVPPVMRQEEFVGQLEDVGRLGSACTERWAAANGMRQRLMSVLNDAHI
jgi:type I restriction enzyme S subunit